MNTIADLTIHIDVRNAETGACRRSVSHVHHHRWDVTMTSAPSSPHTGNTRRRRLHGVCAWVLDGGQGNGEWQHYIGQGWMDARHDNGVDSCHRGVRRGTAVFQSHHAPSCSTVVPTRSHASHVRCVSSLILRLLRLSKASFIFCHSDDAWQQCIVNVRCRM